MTWDELEKVLLMGGTDVKQSTLGNLFAHYQVNSEVMYGLYLSVDKSTIKTI